jgi:hypothetical protein
LTARVPSRGFTHAVPMNVPRSWCSHRSRTTALVDVERLGRVEKSRAKEPLASPMFSSAAYVFPSQYG